MDHDLNIQKDSTIEIAKVSRLLMAIDSGNAAQFVRKQLTENSVEDFDQGDIGIKVVEVEVVKQFLVNTGI